MFRDVSLRAGPVRKVTMSAWFGSFSKGMGPPPWGTKSAGARLFGAVVALLAVILVNNLEREAAVEPFRRIAKLKRGIAIEVTSIKRMFLVLLLSLRGVVLRDAVGLGLGFASMFCFVLGIVVSWAPASNK